MAIEFKLPELGEGIEGGDVLKVLVAEGEDVAEDQPVIELETDKATIEVPAPASGKISNMRVAQGDRVLVGQVILVIEGGAAPAPRADVELASPVTAGEPEERTPTRRKNVLDPAARPVAPLAPASQASTEVAAAPSVRRLAREIGVVIEAVQGTGPRGRISEADVKAHAKRLLSGSSSPAVTGGGVLPTVQLPDFSRFGDVERRPMSGIRRATAQHLSRAWATIPHVTQHDHADISALERFRKEHSKLAEAKGAKLTVTAILVKVVAAALSAFPEFNSSVDMANEEIVLKSYCNIGVAVDTEHGLLVPVIRDADDRSVVELAVELGELAGKARNRKLSLDDMAGGCFTITNLGGIGGTSFTPIVNSPEVAILGVSRSSAQPVMVDGKLETRLMMPLSLSYDHRVIDGAAAARFLRWVCTTLEYPMMLARGV